MDFLDALFSFVGLLSAEGGILVIIILGLTQVAKKFGAKDRVALAVNLAIGLIMGTLIVIGSIGVPVDAAAWVALILFDLLCSLIAAGIYKMVADPEAIT